MLRPTALVITLAGCAERQGSIVCHDVLTRTDVLLVRDPASGFPSHGVLFQGGARLDLASGDSRVLTEDWVTLPEGDRGAPRSWDVRSEGGRCFVSRRPGPTVTGTVVDDQGAPVAWAQVSGCDGVAVTDARGVFVVQVGDGPCSVAARCLIGEQQIRSDTVEAHRWDDVTVRLLADLSSPDLAAAQARERADVERVLADDIAALGDAGVAQAEALGEPRLCRVASTPR